MFSNEAWCLILANLIKDYIRAENLKYSVSCCICVANFFNAKLTRTGFYAILSVSCVCFFFITVSKTYLNLWMSSSFLTGISYGNTSLAHYTDVIMGTIAFQITSFTIVYSTVYSDADQRKYQSSASLAFVWGIHRRPVNSPHKWPVTRKTFPFDDVIMLNAIQWIAQVCLKERTAPHGEIYEGNMGKQPLQN